MRHIREEKVRSIWNESGVSECAAVWVRACGPRERKGAVNNNDRVREKGWKGRSCVECYITNLTDIKVEPYGVMPFSSLGPLLSSSLLEMWRFHGGITEE